MKPEPKLIPLLALWLLAAGIFCACRKPGMAASDHPGHADSIVALGDGLLRTGKNKHFVRFIDSAYRHFAEPGPGDRWKKYKQLSNYYLQYETDIVKAGHYTDSMSLAIAGQTDHYKDFFAQTLFTKGDLLLAEHRYNDAFAQYYHGVDYVRSNLDSCTLALFYSKLGLVKYRQGKYSEAIPYTQKAFRERLHCASDEYLLQSFLNTIAICFERSGKPDSAIVYYQRALQTIRTAPSDTVYLEGARGVIYGNMGGVYAKLKDYARAERFLKKSIAINDRPAYEMEDAITAELKLAEMYLDAKRYSSADSTLQYAAGDLEQQRAMNHINYPLRINWKRLRWQYLDRTGAMSAAYAASKDYYHLRDSVEAISKGLQTADMEAAFAANSQQQRLELLAKDNQIKKRSLWTTIILVLLALLVIWLIILSLRRTRRHNNRLQQTLAELELSEAALAEKTHFLEGLLNNLPVILYQISPEGIITTSEGAGLSAVPGWSNEQMVGLDAFKLAADMAAAFQKAMAGEHVRAINAFGIGPEYFYFDTIVLPDSTRPGGIIGFAVDVSATKKAEQEIKQQAERLEQLNGFKDKLISVISHDLRQPLSSILMASEVLELPNVFLTKDDLQHIVLELRDTAAKSIGLLEGLLVWVQTEKDNFHYKRQAVNLHANVTEANGIYGYSQQRRNITLQNVVPEDLQLMAHHQMLLFINRNLISNATKYSPEGGTIRVGAERKEREIIVSVSDHGPGMDPAKLSGLFRIQDEATADRLRGAGIALSICYDMIRQMGGRIWAESKPGEGTCVYYTLPI